MSLRLIIGKAGTGKTHTCLEEIAKELRSWPEGKEIIFLVPEQATFQMERALTAIPGLEGVMRLQILSFRRLAWRVLGETGGGARVAIGDLGKRMALRNLIRKHPDELQVFAKSAGRFGFIDTLARALGEIKTYQISPEVLGSTTSKLTDSQNLLRGKLADLHLLYRELETFLEGKYTDPDDHLTLLAEGILKSRALKGVELWVDGFTGFTPQEFAVLQNLIQVSAKVNLTLCLDGPSLDKELTEEDLFYPTWNTYKTLIQVAGEGGVTLDEPLILGDAVPYRYSDAPELAHLEKNFYAYPAWSYEGENSRLVLACAANRRAEVEGAAREIIRQCRDEGLRWNQQALVLRDIEPYRELIKTVFHDYGIPVFLDHKRSVMHHPLVELIRSALEAINSDWAYEPVFRFLKTDLVPLTRDETDRLENYVLAHGIRGSRWTDGKDWEFRRQYTLGEDEEVSEQEQERLVLINNIRRRAAAKLAVFAARARKSVNVRDLSVALYTLLEDLKVYETLEKWSQEAQEQDDPEKAREHLQIWGSVNTLFEEIVEALGEEQLTTAEYLEVLDAGLESLKLGLIPPGLDQVFVGSLDRSRTPNVKACFILGVNDGVLPAKPLNESLFNDSEREVLEQQGLKMAPGSRRLVFEEQFLVYTAMTRSSQYLWVSYPLADEEGKALTPSAVIFRLKRLFPALNEKSCHIEPQEGCDEDPGFVAHPLSALGFLGARLREFRAGRKVDALWWDVYNWYSGQGDEKVQLVLAGLFHTNREGALPPGTGKQLYGLPLRTSVSRIERFKACPFAHFAGFGLKLKERQAYKLAAPDMGEFLHAALKGFTDRIRENGLDWGALNREQCANISSEVVEKLAPQLQSEILLSTARYRYLTGKLKRVVTQAASTLAEHARRSTFRPVGLELGFGPGGDLPPLTIPLKDGELQLKGRIDRIDLAKIGDKYYLRVIDYKSSDNQLKLPEIYHGLKLQLLTYLHVVLTHSKELTGEDCEPGGVLYFTLKEPVVNHTGPMDEERVTREILRELKMNGYLLGNPEVIRNMDNQVEGWSELFRLGIGKDGNFYKNSQVISSEQFELLRNYLQNSLMEAGEAILNGGVDIEPYRDKKSSACTYCVYKPVCKFDLNLEDNLYKVLKEVEEEDIWSELGGEEEDHEQPEMD